MKNFLLMFLVMLISIPLFSQAENKNDLLVDNPIELVQYDYSTPDLLSVDATFNSIKAEFRQSTAINYHYNSKINSNVSNFNILVAPDINTTVVINNINIEAIGNNNQASLYSNMSFGLPQSTLGTTWLSNIGLNR